MHHEIYERFEKLVKDVVQEKQLDLPLREIDIARIHFSVYSLRETKSKYPLHEIIFMYYGLPKKIDEKPETPKTLKKIGLIYKISPSRAQQLKDKGLTFLRRGERAYPFIFMVRHEMEWKIKSLEKEIENMEKKLQEK